MALVEQFCRECRHGTPEDPVQGRESLRMLCPTLAALAGGYSLNRCGATLGIDKSWKPYGWLYPELNDYTDVRIIAQAAYAHVLVTKDKGLCLRAKLLRELKLFRPETMTWDELLARPLS